jgi:hypothetical protein
MDDERGISFNIHARNSENQTIETIQTLVRTFGTVLSGGSIH